jgi:hypothetical protein
MLEMHHNRNYEGFSFIYSNLRCYNENVDCEEIVVDRIVAKHQKTEDQETDKDDNWAWRSEGSDVCSHLLTGAIANKTVITSFFSFDCITPCHVDV